MTDTAPTHVMPWWMGYLLASPFRRTRNNPVTMLGPYLEPGMTALDVGCGMGYFSLPMARMVGSEGSVICVDLQERMIPPLRRRAARAGLIARIETRVCHANTLNLMDLPGQVDFALLYAVLHEVPDPVRFLGELRKALRSNGLLFFGEPSGRVDERTFDRELALITAAGFLAAPARHPKADGRTEVFRKSAPC